MQLEESELEIIECDGDQFNSENSMKNKIQINNKREHIYLKDESINHKRQCIDARECSTSISYQGRTNPITEDGGLSTEALIVRGRYPNIVIQTNQSEDDWICDICCSKNDEEEDPLAICDLCNVVVHACCYRKDLYEQDTDDESPWFCQRCTFLLQNQTAPLPQCLFCPDTQGAVIQLKNNQWVHIVCVNWINEIWFEENDVHLQMYGGKLDMGKFNLNCHLCKKTEGQCLKCDSKLCTNYFHVRCAIQNELIIDTEQMDNELRLGEWECKVFCEKHRRNGKKIVKQQKSVQQSQINGEVLISGSSERRKTRLQVERLKRQSLVRQINEDRLISDGEEEPIIQVPQIIQATLEYKEEPIKRILGKKSKKKIVPVEEHKELSQPQQILDCDVLDIPKPNPVKKAIPMILNTKLALTKTQQQQQQVVQSLLSKKLTIEDITTQSTHKFQIDKQLSTYLEITEWCSFKDFTVGLLRFNKKVGDFYCKKTLSFQTDKYPFFQRFFPGILKLTSADVKQYLLSKHK